MDLENGSIKFYKFYNIILRQWICEIIFLIVVLRDNIFVLNNVLQLYRNLTCVYQDLLYI